jgi:nucleotide-binding universal stress UspA family protein
MEMRDILMFVSAGNANPAAVGLAMGWAQAYGAAVTACCHCDDPAPPIPDCYVIGSAGAADVLDRRQAQIEVLARPVEAAFREAAAATGVAATWGLSDPNTDLDQLASRACLFDLVIATRAAGPGGPARELPGALALRGGTPCVVVPAEGDCGCGSGERIVVAWNGSAVAKRALDDALPLLRRAKAVQLLVLGENPRWLDYCRPEPVIRRLARHDIDATLKITRTRAPEGEALAKACEAFAADLLVMGACSHAWPSEVLLGSATREVLADFPIPVLLSR